MTSIILEGTLLGLGLAVSLGPIFIALTQTSIEKGIMPGLTVGSGIWFSDFIIVAMFYNFIYSIKDNIESDNFRLWMGISGAIVLVAFGVFLVLKKPVLDYTNKKHSYKSYLGFWMKGFVINTINPFTFFFWMSVISTYLIGRHLAYQEAMILLVTILAIIILSDTAKVFLANRLRDWLTPSSINKVSNFSGLLMIGFGLFMAYKVM